MAFNDLFSSARGPGVIGMIMALIVLMGFGLLFMLSFEEGFESGGKSLAAIVRDNGKEIEATRLQLEEGEETLGHIPALTETSSALNRAVAKNEFLSNDISSLKARAAELDGNRTALIGEWEDYKNLYRAKVRSEAEGTSLPELKTNDGKVYREVVISKVTALGVNFRHEDGLAHINFQDLPAEIQDHYQYDKDQMLAEAKRHQDARQRMAKAVDAANEVQAAKNEELKAKELEAEREKTIVAISALEAQANSLTGQIRQLEADIVSAEAAASAARAAGRRHLNKAGSLRGELNRKRNELVNVQTSIARMRASL